MANPFYEPGSRRASRVQVLFDTIARRYDRINDLQSFGLHRLWKRYLVSMTRLSPGQRALDLCCGTGDVAFAMARTGAQVTGLDFSPQMLEVARRRQAAGQRAAPETGHGGKVEFVRGDVLELPFAESSFDVVTISYGLRNLADFERGVTGMARLLKAGGRLLVLDFGKPQHRLWRAVYFGYLRAAVPVFGRMFAGSWDAYAYILESLRHYPGQLGVLDLMRRAGLTNLRIRNLLGGAMAINFGEKP